MGFFQNPTAALSKRFAIDPDHCFLRYPAKRSYVAGVPPLVVPQVKGETLQLGILLVIPSRKNVMADRDASSGVSPSASQAEPSCLFKGPVKG